MILIDKKVDFQVLDNLEEIKNKWIETFAGNLTEKEREYIEMNGQLWHIFSYGKKDCLEGEDAIEAFNNSKKTGYYVFFDCDVYTYEDFLGYENKAFEVFGWNKMKAEDFSCDDIYIVDKEFTWTYVYTHEGFWFGPYFATCE